MSGLEDVAGEFRFDLSDTDSLGRAAAFAEVRRLTQVHGEISSQLLAKGFEFQGTRIPFVNPQRGIFKPRSMRYLLSIRTVFPRTGRRIWYDDQREVHRQIYSGDEAVDYAFMGTDPDAPDNRWLKEALESQVPIIYFLGSSPSIYQAIVPAFITDFDRTALRAKVSFSPREFDTRPPTSQVERRYALRKVKQRLHQATFRDMIIGAYKGRCAISALPEPRLLDAAHIVDDGDELLGQPLVTNGIPLSKIHHAAFDANLIGIDPDSRIHVADQLLMLNDGPQLEALRQFHGKKLLEPSRPSDRPDRDRLAHRFESFRAST